MTLFTTFLFHPQVTKSLLLSKLIIQITHEILTQVRTYPAELRALAAMVRLRLYEALALLPSGLLEGSYAQLLRLLVSNTT